jgi:putative acetyltransferase
VRPARPGDLRTFFELLRRVASEGRFIRTEVVPRSRLRSFRRQFRRSWTEEDASLVAVAGGRVVGHLHIGREEHPVNRHVASLGMMVARELRGRGIGTALLAEAIRWAGEAGVEKIALTVYPDNEAARRLYRRFGFQEEGRLTGQSKKRAGYQDEIVMGLWLIPPPDGSAGAP